MIKLLLSGGNSPTHKNLFQKVNCVVVKSLFILASVVLFGMTSCQSLDDINDRLDKVEVEVSDLKSAVIALQDAYGQAKIIRSVLPLEDGTQGWLITFTDNTEIKFVDGIVADVSRDEATGVITISLNDGRSFWFNTHYVCPTSIAILRTRPVELSCGSRDTIEFRVNPSNASFKMNGDECQIELDKVGEVKTRSSYVTAPGYYKLVGVEPVCEESTNVVKIGQYRAIIEDTQVCAEYDEMAALVLNVEDAKGDKIQVSSSAFEVKGHNYDNLPMTGLPVVIINTPNAAPIVSKEEYVTGSSITLLNADMTYDFQGEMKIKGRGNSTWGAPKKPYKLKFDKKQSLYGMPKDKEWVLLANYYDKTMLRTDVAYWMASNYGEFDYVPRFCFVDLMLNGMYCGTYQIGEQLKIGENRVNVGEDGFLLEIDGKASLDDVTFNIEHIAQPINIKDPDVVAGDVNYNYVVDYVSRADAALYAENWLDEEKGYKSLIDMQSFVEWYLMMEITKNADAHFLTSCYMNLSREGKLKMGPLWDFDVSCGGYPTYWSVSSSAINNPEGYRIKSASWISRMFDDPDFVTAVKEKFNDYYNHKSQILNHIDEVANTNRRSVIANNYIWGVLCDANSSPAVVISEYEDRTHYLKSWLKDRLDWLKSQYDAM